VIAIWSTIGCSRLSKFPDRPVIQTERYDSAPTAPHNKSIELLEDDPTFMGDQDPGLRAIALAQLWQEYGTELTRSSYSGAFAAYSRAAHIALKHLLGDTCQTPFHAPCHELDQAYKRAVDSLVRLVSHNSWSPPDLGRTRYTLTTESIRALRSLSDWQISFNHLSYQDPQRTSGHVRPGLGLATVGCRRIADSGTTCSPLTFVITFSADLGSDISGVSIEAFDAFQQEVLTIDGRSIPLAAAMEQTALTLSTIAANAPAAALFCLSAPTLNATTAVFFVEASDAVATSRNILIPLVRDPEFIRRASLCIHTVQGPAARAISPRTIAASLRRAHAAIYDGGIASGYRQPISVIAIGELPTRTALAFANKVSRIMPPRLRRESGHVRFAPESLLIISPSTDDHSIPSDATDLPTYRYHPPCERECLRGIKDSTLRKFSQSPFSDRQGGANPKRVAEDLPLSPVM
jgi:hypothetical protein